MSIDTEKRAKFSPLSCSRRHRQANWLSKKASNQSTNHPVNQGTAKHSLSLPVQHFFPFSLFLFSYFFMVHLVVYYYSPWCVRILCRCVCMRVREICRSELECRVQSLNAHKTTVGNTHKLTGKKWKRGEGEGEKSGMFMLASFVA